MKRWSRRDLTCLSMGLLVATSLSAAPLLQNSDFAAAAAADAALPAAWHVPADTPWQWADDDGQSGKQCIRCRAPRAVVANPVTQEVDLAADTEYVLTAAAKSDGRLKPVIRVRATGDAGAELTRIEFPPDAGFWRQREAKFKNQAVTRVVVELYADAAHLKGAAAGPGATAFDDVQIQPAADQATTTTEPQAAAVPVAAGDDIAKGKRYSLAPPPGYAHCTDPGDKTQLTDGEYTTGYFWTQKTTVGWVNASESIAVTLDIEEDLPIRGVTFNTAAGVAGVGWPASVRVLVSVDGRLYHELGDLTVLDRNKPLPPDGKYAVHRYETDSLRAHGRYVKLLMQASGAYLFADEIEIWRGDDAWRQEPLPGTPVRLAVEYFDDDTLTGCVKRRIAMSVRDAMSVADAAELDAATRARLNAASSRIEDEAGRLPKVDPAGFRAVLPLNPLDAQAFAICGAVRAAQGKPRLVVWGANPWDFLAPMELPDTPPPAAVRVAAMRGETRAGTVNLTNCTGEESVVTIAFDGVPGGVAPDDIVVHEVAWTDTLQGVPVAAALVELQAGPGGYRAVLPAGMTRQVWLSVTPRRLLAGLHQGALVISGGTPDPVRVPMEIRVFDLDFPIPPTLHVGGWDYTDADAQYGVTTQNRDALIQHLCERFVDSPWGTPALMGHGKYDEAGQLTQPPDTTRFHTWLQRWPKARRYCVYNAVGDNIAGTKIDDPLFPVKVGNWIRFWTGFLRERGIAPNQLVLLLLDEPNRNEQDKIIVAWARAVKAAEPDVVLWEDPTYTEPWTALPEMMQAADVLCPNRPQLLKYGADFAQFYRAQKAQGRRLDFYSCSGPVRLLDPYSYHRLQAWTCFDFGAESTFFWAFGDTSGADSWNEYFCKRDSFSPLFLSKDSVTPGRHMEAIRESVEDYEYLVMLRDRIAALEKAAPGHALLPKAKELLATAPGRVLQAPGVDALDWRDAKDRSIADTVRIEVAGMLEQLK
ncbi:MAG: hypothetical protein A3K19_06845 [Lentisphaerae bacterium RIFOXYB12_FULL_65_16]|nr:MAG: hypothetical protein A3K18_20035 [Lentisphaerae bacterium RIFOXYA12_64_32]OGV93167.1 MAG: hypothetical protein A3K19_06845 [Lentisphaerae bacterium RIFOXYB12_FULL_65_16]